MPKSLLHRLFSSFMVYGLRCKSLIYFEFLFIYGVKKIVHFHSYACISPSFLNTTYCSHCFTLCPCLLCHRLIDHISEDLLFITGLSLYSIHLYKMVAQSIKQSMGLLSMGPFVTAPGTCP